MKVNREIMEKARARKKFESRPVSSLTVTEFKALMQGCFDEDRKTEARRKWAESEKKHAMNTRYP